MTDRRGNVSKKKLTFGLRLWRLTPLSTTSQLYRGCQLHSVEENGVLGEHQRPSAIH